MTIAEVREKCKTAVRSLPRDVFIVSAIVLAAFMGFGLGYLAGQEAGQGSGVTLTASPLVSTSTDGAVVASKNGTKYYFAWCAGADRISEANKVWFPSADAARTQGYAPASNCGGL